MTGFLLAFHPVFRRVALREVHAVDPGAQVVEELDPAAAHVRPAVPRREFVARLAAARPVFVRHAAPVELDVDLSEAEDPMATLVAAFDPSRLDPAKTFAVESRKLHVAGEGVPFGARDVEVRLGTCLAERGFPVDMEAPDQLVSVALHRWRALVGVSRPADNLSPHADEYRRYSRLPSPVSRAGAKLREALELWPLDLPAGRRALDVGAAPGGWTHVLAGLGLRVVAVDPADLSEVVLANPLVTHVRARMETAGLESESFDLVVNDMNLDPDESAALMCEAAPYLAPGAPAIMTIKVTVRSPLRLIRGTIAVLQHAYQVHGVRNLFHNRQEVTVLLRRKAAIRPGWEPLVGHDPGASARRREWRRSHAMDPGEGEIPLVLRRPAAAVAEG
ncbi:MAG TPA: SAM-dependent methyltransferase [Candidatus Dormibacteraeota bacterium]|nr:SAM-dependent methyltransferase [Candidatus Dormibacteraeota bacterium]